MVINRIHDEFFELANVRNPAKQFVKSAFNAFGLELRKKRLDQSDPIPRASMTGVLRQLRSLGFRPRTVIDVGVAYKTAELYNEFKESKFLLIEPLVEFEPFLRDICSTYHAQYVLAAAGKSRGTAVLNVHPDLCGSSSFNETEGRPVDGEPRQVPVITIDDLCGEKGLRGPFLIKVDVQGAELEVLAGASHSRTLEETDALLLETTLFGTMIGGPQLYDVVSRMKELGFVVYDLFGFNYRPFDNALAQVDTVFVRENGLFRQHHVFATPEQRKECLRGTDEVAREAWQALRHESKPVSQAE